MKKFNYVKWKSGVLPGLLTEQVTPPTCYICNSGSSLPIQGQQTGPAFEMNWGGGVTGFYGPQGQCMVTGSWLSAGDA